MLHGPDQEVAIYNNGSQVNMYVNFSNLIYLIYKSVQKIEQRPHTSKWYGKRDIRSFHLKDRVSFGGFDFNVL